MMKQKLIVRTDPDLPLLPLHGVMGGVTQAGEIEMLIYTDVDALPAPRELLLAEDGSLVNEETADDNGSEPTNGEVRHILRTVHARTVMTGDQARLVASWLLKQIDILEDNEAARRLGPEDDGPLSLDDFADMAEGHEEKEGLKKGRSGRGRNSKSRQ